MATADLSPAAIEARLRAVSALADLHPDRRLHGKIDYSPEGIRARIVEVGELNALGRRLAAARPAEAP
jgi:hypothetical protein